MKINHLREIQRYWNSEAEDYKKNHPEHLDSNMHPSWGLWHIPEAALNLMPKDLSGVTLLDLGCGRGHDAVAYGKLGAKVTAIDVSEEQLKNAIEHPNVKYMHCPAEKVPLSDESFDCIISDHGAFDHSPADLLLMEAVRLLKPGGHLIICTYSPLAYCCYNNSSSQIESVLINDYPAANVKFDDRVVVAEYSYSSWIAMFNKLHLTIERLEEVIIPNNSKDYFDELVDKEWASRWPCDIIWKVCKKPL